MKDNTVKNLIFADFTTRKMWRKIDLSNISPRGDEHIAYHSKLRNFVPVNRSRNLPSTKSAKHSACRNELVYSVRRQPLVGAGIVDARFFSVHRRSSLRCPCSHKGGPTPVVSDVYGHRQNEDGRVRLLDIQPPACAPCLPPCQRLVEDMCMYILKSPLG